jgi:hypothetical protein
MFQDLGILPLVNVLPAALVFIESITGSAFLLIPQSAILHNVMLTV